MSEARSCGGCEYAFRESWPRGKKAIRCGYEGGGARPAHRTGVPLLTSGECRGRITHVISDGRGNGRLPAPAWCGLGRGA